MLRKLIDLPGIADLERKALMNPRYAEADARAHYAEIDQCSVANFAITADAADEIARPAGWDGIERKPLREQVEAFEKAGWDVTDARRRPLRMLEHFNLQLWMALRGVAGSIPFAASDDEEIPKAWGVSLQAAATRYKRDKR
jgi:hypothetical protein